MGKVYRLRPKMDSDPRRAYYFEDIPLEMAGTLGDYGSLVLLNTGSGSVKEEIWKLSMKEYTRVDDYLRSGRNPFCRRELVCETDDICNWFEEILERGP